MQRDVAADAAMSDLYRLEYGNSHGGQAMEFMNPHYLWLLLAFPVYFAVWFYWGRRSHTLKNTQVSRVRVSTKAGAALTALIWLSKGALWTSLVMGLAGTVFPFNKVGTDAAGV